MESESRKRREAIIAKVRALLAKTVENGATEHEALQAASVAARMMAKYDLEMSDLDVKEAGTDQSGFGLDPVLRRHMKLVAMAISSLCGVRTWGDGDRPDFQVFFGLPHDVEVATYLAAICERAMKEEVAKASREWTLFVRRRAKLEDSFLIGMSERLCERLRELSWARHKATGSALVPLKDAIIEKAMKEKDIKLTQRRIGGWRHADPDAFTAGLAAGERVRLDPAVEGAPENGLID